MEQAVRKLIEQGEGLKVEFKECQFALTGDIYETVCAFLNQNGGEILLGVSNNGTVQGVFSECIEQIKKDFVSNVNNANKINPPVYLGIEEVLIDDKAIVYINVPESSQVNRCNGKIFIRNQDGDYDITNNNTLVSQLYLRKQNTYSENQIYPYLTMDDLRQDLIDKMRHRVLIRNPEHVWKDLDNFQLLKSASLYFKDLSTQKEGFSLACALLFGKDEVIANIVPHYRTDMILRIKDVDRYDDRDDIRTNLIESYERIMAFIQKHLPSPFFLENDIRIDLRNKIFRELAANILIHREYSSHFISRIVIEKDKIYAENGNKPYLYGNIEPDNFRPYTKNPIIAKFFKEIGYAEELGSGVRNFYKYCKAYAGHNPTLEDGNLFKMTLPVNFFKEENKQLSPKNKKVQDKKVQDKYKIIEFCKTPKSKTEIMEMLGYKSKHRFAEKINALIAEGLIKQTIPDKPTSKNQKYYSLTINE